MKKRTLCLLLIPLFILLSCLPGLISRSAFEYFTDTYFTQVMTANTLHLHYSLAHPENFGIPSYEISLPPYEAGSELSGGTYLSERVSQLSTLLRLPVSASQRQSARLLLWDLKSSLALADFPYYEEPLSPVSGIQSQLPVLLAEYTLQSRKDIEEYLALLKLAGPYLESLLIYEQEKSAAGLSQPRSSLLKAAFNFAGRTDASISIKMTRSIMMNVCETMVANSPENLLK